MKKLLLPSMWLLALCFFAVSCDDDDDTGTDPVAKDEMGKADDKKVDEKKDEEKKDEEKKDEEAKTDEMGTISLKFEKLGNLGESHEYEGWVLVDGNPVSTGRFTVGDDGKLSKYDFEVKKGYLEKATDFILTIEPKKDDPPAPSIHKMLAGKIAEKKANVNTYHPAVLGLEEKHNFADETTTKGVYFLKTPTTTSKDDETAGIWFFKFPVTQAQVDADADDNITETRDPSQGLYLPKLKEGGGWIYEGWIVTKNADGQDVPISTGVFLDPAKPDKLAPGRQAHSGEDADAPPYPGEDLIKNAPEGVTFPHDLKGKVTVISIEPYPDNSPAPFAFKPLWHKIGDQAKDGILYDFKNYTNDTFPTGTVTIK